MSTPVELIKEKLPIIDVARSYFKVEKAGRNFKARCPFHSEKTPSFFLSPDRNTFYCFGCGAKGDIFSLVERFEGLDFLGALVELAKRAHVSLEEFGGSDAKDQGKDVLLKVHEEATQFFEGMLSHHEDARAYLRTRGLHDDTIESWRLGFAQLEWRSLHEALKSKGYTDVDIERSGFIKKADPSRRGGAEAEGEGKKGGEEVKLGRGYDAARVFLRENPPVHRQILKLVRAKLDEPS